MNSDVPLVIVTILLVIIGGINIWVVNKSARDAKRSADGSEMAAKTFRNEFELRMRPWVCSAYLKPLVWDDILNAWEIRLENSGNIPAERVITDVQFVFDNKKIGSQTIPTGSLFPQQHIYIPLSLVDPIRSNKGIPKQFWFEVTIQYAWGQSTEESKQYYVAYTKEHTCQPCWPNAYLTDN